MAKKIISQTEYNRRRDKEAEKYKDYLTKWYMYKDFNDYLKKEKLEDIIWTSVVIAILFGFFSLILYSN